MFVFFSRIRIQAINEIGAGPFSQFIKTKTRPLPPLPPKLECAAAGPQSLKLKWGDSNAKTHAADDMVYTLQLEDRNKRYDGVRVHRETLCLWLCDGILRVYSSSKTLFFVERFPAFLCPKL